MTGNGHHRYGGGVADWPWLAELRDDVPVLVCCWARDGGGPPDEFADIAWCTAQRTWSVAVAPAAGARTLAHPEVEPLGACDGVTYYMYVQGRYRWVVLPYPLAEPVRDADLEDLRKSLDDLSDARGDHATDMWRDIRPLLLALPVVPFPPSYGCECVDPRLPTRLCVGPRSNEPQEA